MKTKIAIVDDHELMARALSGLIQKFENYEVIFEVFSGADLKVRIGIGLIPEVILLDVSMPQMDGYEVANWLRYNHPSIKVLALSMNNRQEAIVKMLRNGAKGYLLKGCTPHELKQGLDSLMQKGHYYTDYLTSQLIRNLNSEYVLDPIAELGLNDRELQFVRFSCSELTYAEISDKMCVSPRTVDGYREAVFFKMNVKSRVGMVLEALRLGLFEM